MLMLNVCWDCCETISNPLLEAEAKASGRICHVALRRMPSASIDPDPSPRCTGRTTGARFAPSASTSCVQNAEFLRSGTWLHVPMESNLGKTAAHNRDNGDWQR